MADTDQMTYDDLMEEFHKTRVENAVLRSRRAMTNADLEDFRDVLRQCHPDDPETRERKEALLGRHSGLEHKQYLRKVLRDCAELSIVYAYARSYVDQALAAESYETQTRSFQDLVDALREIDKKNAGLLADV